MITVALLPGDGVGPEVLAGPVELLRGLASAGAPLRLTGPWPVGSSAAKAVGALLPEETIAACEAADDVLLGAIGHEPNDPPDGRPELALIGLRQHFALGINVRHIWHGDGESLVFVRNLLGGAYVDDSLRTEGVSSGRAVDQIVLEQETVTRVLAVAHSLLPERTQLISVDKANLMATSRLWRTTVAAYCAERRIEVRHVFVDSFASELVKGLMRTGVVVTEGLFGDILTDLAAARAGSPAMCSSASITTGNPYRLTGLYEPMHGSAPRLAGRGRANPSGGYLALAALLDSHDETQSYAVAIRAGLQAVLSPAGLRTYDLVRPGEQIATTAEFAAAVNEHTLRAVACIPADSPSAPAGAQ